MVKTYYGTDITAPGSIHLQMDPDVAPGVTTTSTGWHFGGYFSGGAGCDMHAHNDALTPMATTGFFSGLIVKARGNAYRTASPLTGTFAVGPWTFTLPLINHSHGRPVACRAGISIWRHLLADPDNTVPGQVNPAVDNLGGGSGPNDARLVFGSNVRLIAGEEEVTEVVYDPGLPFTLTNHYLFVVVVLQGLPLSPERVIAENPGNDDRKAIIDVGPSNKLVTPDFA